MKNLLRRFTLGFVIATAVACAFTTRAAIQMNIGKNFTAATLFQDAFVVPPDSNGAIGPNHFVEFINGRFSVFDKIAGTKVQTMTDSSFWNNAGVSPGGSFVSDPRVIYDPLSSRWFAVQIDVPNPEISNNFLLAVSVTADPTGAWKGVAWQADPDGSFADYPRLGIDAKGVYLTGNQFDVSGNYVGTIIASIPKADLLLPDPVVTNRTTSSVFPGFDHGFTLQPVINFNSTNDAEFVLATDADGTDFAPHNQLVTFKVQDAETSAATFTSTSFLSVPNYNIPINPPQPDGQSNLDDSDLRIGAYAWQVGDFVFAAHAVQENSRAAIRWYRLRASDSSLVESGTISDTNLHLFYPAIAANTNGFVVIAFNGCSTNTFVSSFAVAGRTINGETVFGPRVLLKAGAANYEANFGGGVRWGDYSTITVDDANANHFWTIQEFPSAGNIWSTQVTEMIVSESPPILKIAALTNQVQLFWPTNEIGFSLQFTTNLAPPVSWSAVTNTVSIVGTNNAAFVSSAEAMNYFRLIR